MVGTLRAASENDKQNGRCTQRPYIAEREQVQDDEVGLKRKTKSPTTHYSLLTTQ